MKKTNKVLGMAAAVATGREDAMLAWATFGGDRQNTLAWAKSQEELYTAIKAESGCPLLAERARVAALKARALAA